MAALAAQDRRVVKFTSPGLQADVRLKVLNVDFHVHSVLLKLHSSFFRKFLDSPDKEGSIPGSAEFKYEWVTKIDEDGSWHLVSAHTQTGRANNTEEEGDKETSEKAFEIILRSIYREPYKIETLPELYVITQLADYYGALRVVSNSFLTNFFHFRLRRDIQMYCSDFLTLASKLRNRELFNESLLFCLGPWHSPVYLDELDGKLRDVADKAYKDIAEHILAPAEKAVTDYVTKVTVIVDNVKMEMRDHMGNVASKLLKTTGRISLPAYYQELMNFKSGYGGHPFQPLLGGLMGNRLSLNIDGEPGAGKYRDYFLCAWIDDKDLPWDINEVDW